MPHENIRERIQKVAIQDQQPKDRLWGVIFVVAVLVFALGATTVLYSESIQNFLTNGRELGYERGAVECLQVVVDDDRDFELSGYCGKQQVIIYYPPTVCDEYFPGREDCGNKWYAA